MERSITDTDHSIKELEQQKKILVKITDSLSDQVIQAQKEKELAEQKAQEARYRAIGELAARIAHDMKNPLSIIKNQLEIVKSQQNDNPKSDDGFQRIEKAIWRLSHQIDDVLDFVKTGPTNIDSNSILVILRESVDAVSIYKNITVNLPEEDAIIDCDEKLIKIVFTNLLVNAAQAMNEQGQISIRLESAQDHIKVMITDQGPGIPEQDLPRIFEPLYTTKQYGTGLGLAGAKNIIESHGGKIFAKNNPTTFVVELPYSKPKD